MHEVQISNHYTVFLSHLELLNYFSLLYVVIVCGRAYSHILSTNWLIFHSIQIKCTESNKSSQIFVILMGCLVFPWGKFS